MGVKILGAFLGSESFASRLLDKGVNSISRVLSKLILLQDQDPHLEYVLLRSCFSLPKQS